MATKLIGKYINMKCGATILLKGKTPWFHGGEYQTVLQFRITDPNQDFHLRTLSNGDESDKHTVEIAVTRKAIPALIRLLKKAYVETKGQPYKPKYSFNG